MTDLTERTEWLVMIYHVPSEPSRLRATVWRRLKSLGAIYLQHGVAALPAGQATERALRSLSHEVVSAMRGTAALLQSGILVGDRDVVAAFNAARDDEYEEIIDKCADFRSQVEKEHVANHFTYAELEENEEDLTKLRGWFTKITARDLLGAARRAAAQAELDRCEQVLNEYANRVYAVEQA